MRKEKTRKIKTSDKWKKDQWKPKKKVKKFTVQSFPRPWDETHIHFSENYQHSKINKDKNGQDKHRKYLIIMQD